MTSKEFYSELEIVVGYLRRTPNMLGILKLHLSQYDHPATARRLLPDWFKTKRVSKRFEWITDMCYFYDVVIDMYFLMYEVLEDFGLCEVNVRRLMRNWIAKVSSRQINLRHLGLLLKDYEDFILIPLQDSPDGIPVIPNYKAFKASIRNTYPDIHWWFDILKKPLMDWLANQTISSFRLVYQVVEYMLRSTLKSLDLRRELCEEYIAYEDILHRQLYDKESLNDFRAVAYAVMGEDAKVHFNRIVPHHGPGANSEEHRQSLYYKYNSLSYQKYSDRGVGIVYTGDWFLGEDQGGWTPLHSQIVDVPKNYNKRRIISKEDVTNQYMQHGIHDCLYGWIRDRRSVFFRHIDLEHQEYNGEFAKLGSMYGDYVTVDLSSASDSVTCTLIRQFPKWIRRYLMSFRSPVTKLPDGRMVDLEKYAPMGADTCFPMECIVFAMACIIAIARYHGVRLQGISAEELIRVLRHSSFRVYGDDIVIEYRYVEQLYKILAQLNFKVNTRKSYSNIRSINFRESCGYEFVNGVDVSPIRVSRQRYYWSSYITSASSVTQLVSYYNECFDHNFRYLQKLWYRRISNSVVHVPRDGKLCERNYPLRRMLPFIHADDFVGQLALKTWVPPTNYQLMKGCPGFSGKSASECRADHCNSLGYQVPHYWGLCLERKLDENRNREEIRMLWSKRCPVFEVDYVRWIDFWSTKERKHCRRTFVPKELSLPDAPRHHDVMGGSPEVLCTIDVIRVRPIVTPV